MLAAVAAVVLSVTAQAPAAGSPRSLYNALLTQPFRTSELPAGFTSARVALSVPGKAAREHHVVGEVEVTTKIANANTSILYLVFPTAANARADIREFLKLAAEIPIVPEVQEFPLADANRALAELKAGKIRGAKVLITPKT